MAVVEAFSLGGIHCCFYSNDHEPPHFHAKRQGEWHARVHFLLSETEMIEVLWGKMKGADRRRIIKSVEARRLQLSQQWSVIRSQGHGHVSESNT